MKSVTHRMSLIILLTALSVMLASCSTGLGKSFGQKARQLGIDGYVYVPEQLSVESSSKDSSMFRLNDFRTAGGYLYYTTGGIYRIPLTDKPDFSAAELVRNPSFMTGFTVDQEQNLYYCTSPKYADFNSAEAPDCITLSKYSSEGALCYQLPLPGESDSELQSGSHSPIAVDGKGNVLLLTENSILKVDQNGSLTGKYTLDDSLVDSHIQKYLLQIPDGQIYYIADNYYNASREAYLVTGDNTPEITLITGLSGNDFPDLYAGLNGLLLKNSDRVLQCPSQDSSADAKSSSSETKNESPESAGSFSEEIFCFEDADMIESDVDNLVQLDQEHFLVSMSILDQDFHSSQELFFLTKTAVEELPEKELLVLASLFPTDELKRAVVKFNQASDKYHVSIESYGATNPWADNDGAYTRLDSSLVSGDSPDILDLAYLDIGKYAENGVIADLSPYMEQSSSLRPEQYLDNLRAGYTADGKLLCLPQKFYVFAVYGYDDRTASIENWTMEEAIALSEESPDTRLLPGIWNTSSFMLEDFCAAYYLEEFMDLEKGSCSFDSGGFCSLLEWIKNQLAFGSDYEGGLLGTTYLYNFSNFWSDIMKEGTIPTLLGFPSAEGSKAFRIYTCDAVGMTADSRHSEGAWAFLEYYMTAESDSAYNTGFPSRKAQLAALAEDMVTPSYIKDYEGNPLTDQDGNYLQAEKWTSFINGEPLPCYVMEQSHVDAVMDMINSLDFTPRSALENSVIKIVTEEAEYYFNNSKTVKEVAAVIQNRVQNLIQENR